MVKSKTELEQIISDFVAELEKDIIVDQIFLFGSYSKGNPRKDSDIDLLVVSPGFEGKSQIENLKYLLQKSCDVNLYIEPFPAAPTDIAEADHRGFLGQVARKGKPVFRRKIE